MTGRARVEAVISEAQFQQRVIETARLYGWRVVHYRAAQVRSGRWVTPVSGDVGAPDLLLARGGVALLAELKSNTGRTRPGQPEWLDALGPHGRLWKPADWQSIVEELK